MKKYILVLKPIRRVRRDDLGMTEEQPLYYTDLGRNGPKEKWSYSQAFAKRFEGLHEIANEFSLLTISMLGIEVEGVEG